MVEKTNIDDIIGLVKTEEKTDSVELKKEYYKSRMTENKQYTLKEIDNFNYSIKVTDVIMDNNIELPQSTVCDLLNEQEELIKRLRQIKEEQTETILKQKRKIKKLTTQLQTEEESVCTKCKHHHLIKYPDETSKYYISKCKKEHEECSKEDIRYCEDFELKGDKE